LKDSIILDDNLELYILSAFCSEGPAATAGGGFRQRLRGDLGAERFLIGRDKC